MIRTIFTTIVLFGTATELLAEKFAFEDVETLKTTDENSSLGIKSLVLAAPGEHLSLDSMPEAVVQKAIKYCGAGKTPTYTIPTSVERSHLRSGKTVVVINCADGDGEEIYGAVTGDAEGISCKPLGRKLNRSRLQQFLPRGLENNCVEKESWSRVASGDKYVHIFWGASGLTACNGFVKEFKQLFYEGNDEAMLFAIRNHSGDRLAIAERVSGYLTQRLTCESIKSQTFKTSVENAVRADRLSKSGNYDRSARDQKDRDKILKSPFGAPTMTYCKEIAPLLQKAEGFKYLDLCQDTDKACNQSRTVKINEVNSAILTATEKLRAAIKKPAGDDICCKMTPDLFVFNPMNGKCSVKPISYLAH